MRTVLFRADSSPKLGLGHIMRGVGLGQAFEQKGIELIFTAKDCNQQLKKIIQSYGYRTEFIPKDCSFSQDAVYTLKKVQKHKANLIIIDLNNSDTWANLTGFKKYLQVLKRNGCLVACFDAFDHECIARKIKLPTDYLVIPYYGAEKLSYKVDKKTKLFLGTKYFILRQEFIKAVKQRRKIKKRARNVLINLNTSFSLELIQTIENALTQVNLLGIDYQIAFNLKDKKLVWLMLWADLIILSSGLTKYEAAALGLPSLVISHNKVHKRIMNKFVKSGVSLHLGTEDKVEEGDIIKTISYVLKNYSLREKMSKKGKQLVDGQGGKRLINKII